MSLSQNVVRQDHKLERAAGASQEALAKHRWRWTLDASNAERVTPTQYAKAVGRTQQGVARMARGYANWLADVADPKDPRGPRDLADHIALADAGVERAAVIDAVAKAKGSTTSTAKRDREVPRVHESARRVAERRGTSVAEEAQRIAERNERARRNEASRRKQERAAHSLQWVRVDGDLGKAKRALLAGLHAMEDVEFSDDERDLLLDDVRNLRAVLKLYESALRGSAGVDWDRELARLTEGGAA